MNFSDVIQRLPIGFFILFGLFVATSIVELVFAFIEKESARRIVKPFLMLFLMLACWLALPTHNFIVASLICALIGDILVVVPNKKCFPLGVVFFFFGHIFYIIEVCANLLHGNLSTSQIIVIIAMFVVIFVSSFMLIFRKIAENKPLGLGMSLYFATLLSVLPTMCIATANFGYFMGLSIAGSVFFIASDSLLMYCKYFKKIKRHHFYIMITYLIAQSLIVLGFVLSYTASTL